MEEGGGRIENTTLFGKYQICRILGSGRSGTVYLARHKDLEEFRAIKRVPKTCKDYGLFRQEALIMKSLRHPGIPLIYDLEEDQHYSYLIEEFLEGDSLYALISEAGHFSKAMTVSYGIQICRLVYTLHFAKPYPILYLDLQPKNLLLCNHTIKLVDFDHAVHLPGAERLTMRYGTIGYAAPEQYTGETLDERTDIYAIGAVLYYMLTGQYPGEKPVYPKDRIDRKLACILDSCLKRDKSRRYKSVEQLCDVLEQILQEEQGVFKKIQASSLTIAIAGARQGAGSTHLALGLAAYLRRQGCSVLYEEKNDSGGVRQFAACTGAGTGQDGTCRIQGLSMLPRYGTAVKLKPHSYPVVIQDYGTDWAACKDAAWDGMLLVCPGKPWEWESARDAAICLGNSPGLAIIYNHIYRQSGFRLPGPAKEMQVFLMPYYSNPFQYSKETAQFFSGVLLHLFPEGRGCFRRLGRRLFQQRFPGNRKTPRVP